MAAIERTVSNGVVATPWVSLGASLLPEINELLKFGILVIGLATGVYALLLKRRQWKHRRDFMDTGKFKVIRWDDRE